MATASADSRESAREARLRWVSDAKLGLRRRRRGRSFAYVDAEGRAVHDAVTLRRIRALAIPPAWTDVWISADPSGHIQATGRDARRRKQYRYHRRWHIERDLEKYDRLLEFGRALPAIRAHVARDLRRDGLPRERVLAAIVRLLDVALVRVGNLQYLRENNSQGITTLRSDQAHVDGAAVRFAFRGKTGKQVTVAMNDRRVARALARCTALPGEELFQYVDVDGRPQPVTSDDVNGYLRCITGREFTAKDFRTWGGTVLVAACLHAMGGSASTRERKQMLARAIDTAASRLGNTPSVCRASYIHPAVVAAHEDGSLLRLRARPSARDDTDSALTPDERMVLRLLRTRGNGSGRRHAAAPAGAAPPSSPRAT